MLSIWVSVGRKTHHNIFRTLSGVRITLTDFELSNVKVRLCRDKEEQESLYLVPTRRARNSYVDYGQKEEL